MKLLKKSRVNGFNNTRFLAGVFVWSLYVLLVGCSSTPQTDTLLAEAKSTPVIDSVELTDVPFISQEKYQCGPASLAMVMQYSGLNVNEQELRSDVYLPAKEGAFQIELKAATRKRGWVPFEIPKNLSALYEEIKAGHPVLVMQNLGLEEYPVWHYAVVIGFDFSTHEIILRSGTTKRWTTTLRTFERTWQRTHYWGITVMPPHQIPMTATPDTWLKTAYELQTVGQKDAALTAYQAGIQRWPSSEPLHMVTANLLYEQSKFPEAVDHYEKALHLAPERADAWNNYAYALAALNCREVSRRAVACARKLAPSNANIKQSQRELKSKSFGNSALTAEKPEFQCQRTPVCPLK